MHRHTHTHTRTHTRTHTHTHRRFSPGRPLANATQRQGLQEVIRPPSDSQMAFAKCRYPAYFLLSFLFGSKDCWQVSVHTVCTTTTLPRLKQAHERKSRPKSFNAEAPTHPAASRPLFCRDVRRDPPGTTETPNLRTVLQWLLQGVYDAIQNCSVLYSLV